MSEKTHFRNCPKCGKQCGYVTVYKRDKAVELEQKCRSCSMKDSKAEPRQKAKMLAYKQSITDAYTEMYGVKAKRKQYALRKWGKEVQERDDYQCQCCGAEKTTPLSMHSHHIVPCEYFPHLALDISNGITLCTGCHFKLHKNIDRLTMSGIKLDAEGFRENYNGFMSKHSFLRPFIPSSVLDIELRSVSYLMQQTA